ncbi:type II toxin-antitoxin system VapC family toxin [Halomonas sediminis]
MSGSYLLDTNVFINAIRHGVRLPLASYSYSVITELELLSFPGLPSEEEASIRSILRSMTRIELGDDIKDEVIRVRRGTRMKLPDSIISASAIVTSATLVMDDAKMVSQHAGDVVSLDALVNR